MRIAIKLNGTAQYMASLPGAGHLGVHLNLHNRAVDGAKSGAVRAEGYDRKSPNETVSMQWEELKLGTGDLVELQILEDGPGDPPQVSRSTTEEPTNLFSDANLAKEVIAIVAAFEEQLLGLLEKSESVQPTDEHKKFKRAVGHVFADFGEHLLTPVYRRHPDLLPPAWEGEMP
jgi:hypothetical protein